MSHFLDGFYKEAEEKKKNLSTKAKVGIGLGVAALAGLGGYKYLSHKHMQGKDNILSHIKGFHSAKPTEMVSHFQRGDLDVSRGGGLSHIDHLKNKYTKDLPMSRQVQISKANIHQKSMTSMADRGLNQKVNGKHRSYMDTIKAPLRGDTDKRKRVLHSRVTWDKKPSKATTYKTMQELLDTDLQSIVDSNNK